ncbi:MAG: LapA family protein [Pseudomonadota bacterium]|nr:LapA family protein [Pseudomonadota bacterium]
MRLLRLLVALSCLATGIAVGALNPQTITIDLGIAVLRTTLGVAILVSLLAGVVIGGLVMTASVVLPLRQRLRRAEAGRSSARPTPPVEGI